MPAVTFTPNTPEWLADPFPSYRELREQDPVHWSELLGHWVLTRYEDVSFVLKDERFSAANRAPQRRLNRPTTMVTADPPDHTRLRKSVRHRLVPVAASSATTVPSKVPTYMVSWAMAGVKMTSPSTRVDQTRPFCSGGLLSMRHRYRRPCQYLTVRSQGYVVYRQSMAVTLAPLEPK